MSITLLAGVSADNRGGSPSAWSAGKSESYFSRKCSSDDSIIVRDDVRDLRALPYASDYLVLACVVVAMYCQQIFDAVPLVLVAGPTR